MGPFPWDSQEWHSHGQACRSAGELWTKLVWKKPLQWLPRYLKGFSESEARSKPTLPRRPAASARWSPCRGRRWAPRCRRSLRACAWSPAPRPCAAWTCAASANATSGQIEVGLSERWRASRRSRHSTARRGVNRLFRKFRLLWRN